MSDYPKTISPVDHVEPVARRIRAQFAGAMVLDTTGARYLWEWPCYPLYILVLIIQKTPAMLVWMMQSNPWKGSP